MSHFTVIVIGDNVEKQLAPYHEFECTGLDDEYVVDVDITEDRLRGYQEETQLVRMPDGTIVTYYDDRFYPPGGRLSDAEILETFPGAEVFRGPSSMGFSTFAEFLLNWCGDTPLNPGQAPGKDHMFGYVQLDEDSNVVKVIRRTNPNAKWDGYVVGGRWSGFFPLKRGHQGDLGEPGTFGGRAPARTADSCLWGDVDTDRDQAEAAREAEDRFRPWAKALDGNPRPKAFAVLLEEAEANPQGEDSPRTQATYTYNNQPAIQAYNRAVPESWDCPVMRFGLDRKAYVDQARQRSLVPYAVVKDGKWYQQGEMGWFGMSSDEMTQAEWNTQVWAMYNELPDETQVTLVDCHI